jgi:two-component system, NtrC family, response regulator AtoC
MTRSVLLVDDDDATLRLLRRFFERQGWVAHASKSPQKAIATFEIERPSLVILDLHMPVLDGIELLEILRERDPDTSVLMLTGHGDVESAVKAMRLGAQNYLTKPVSLDHLQVVAEAALERTTLRRRNRVLTNQQEGRNSGGGPITAGLLSEEMDATLRRVAESDATVLVEGETGTGKNSVARAIHARSARAGAPFIEADCARFSEENLELRLFGGEQVTSRGVRVHPLGLLELAEGGTLVLDGIEMLHPELQPKLLNVLATRRFRRVGGHTEVAVDVRLIAISGTSLEGAVAEGKFREDLFYRLSVFPLRLPSVREHSRARVSDLLFFLLHGLRRGDGEDIGISPEAEALLVRYPWPGNVREMRNALERILILHPGVREIQPEHLPPEVRGGAAEEQTPALADPTLPLDEVERRHLRAALAHFGGNKSQTARSLGIGRRTLYEKMDRYRL